MGRSVGHERLAMFETLRAIIAIVIAMGLVAILAWALSGKLGD